MKHISTNKKKKLIILKGDWSIENSQAIKTEAEKIDFEAFDKMMTESDTSFDITGLQLLIAINRQAQLKIDLEEAENIEFAKELGLINHLK